MINILKAEFFKLRKSKALWTTSIILVGYSLLVMTLFIAVGIIAGSFKEGGVDIGSMPEAQGMIPSLRVSGALSFFGNIYGGFMIAAIVVCIIAARFYAGENRSGVLRNSLTAGISRQKIYLAKFIMTMLVAAAAYFIILIIYMAVFAVVCAAGGGDVWGSVNFGVFLGYLVLQLLLFLSVAALIFWLSIAVKSSGATMGITFGFIYFFMVLSVLALAGGELSGAFNADVVMGADGPQVVQGEPAPFFVAIAEICTYLAPTQIGNVASMNLEPIRLVQSVLVGVITFAAAFAGGLFLFLRRDHK